MIRELLAKVMAADAVDEMKENPAIRNFRIGCKGCYLGTGSILISWKDYDLDPNEWNVLVEIITAEKNRGKNTLCCTSHWLQKLQNSFTRLHA